MIINVRKARARKKRKFYQTDVVRYDAILQEGQRCFFIKFTGVREAVWLPKSCLRIIDEKHMKVNRDELMRSDLIKHLGLL